MPKLSVDADDAHAPGEEQGPAKTGTPSRRSLLGAAAGGFALAASGLLLPAWLSDDAEAADHPSGKVQHRAGKRRQRGHHRAKQQRREQDRRSDSPAPQGGRRKNIQFNIHNDRPNPSGVSIHIYVDEGSVGTDWKSRPAFWFPFGASKELAYQSTQVGFTIYWDNGGSKHFVSARDPLIGSPIVTVREGGYNGPDGTVHFRDDFPGNGGRIVKSNHATFDITRLADTASHVVFDVRFNLEGSSK